MRVAAGMALLALAGCEVLFPFEPGPPDAAAPGRWRSVHAGVHTTYAIDTAGALWAWGESSNGAVGDGTQLERNTPVLIDAGPWASVAPGHMFACAIHPDRRAACWGLNSRGQLGIGLPEIEYLTSPMPISGTWDAIAAGAEHACGISDGTLWCWGRDDEGQAAQGQGNLYAPVQVGTETDWDAVAAGSFHSCGRRRDGSIFCWGSNAYGQLGVGMAFPGTMTPTLVAGLGPSGPPETRHVHTCALQTGDGSAWCWGLNAYGEIGDGTVGLTPVPARVMGDTAWTAIDVGMHHTCGLRAGELACWGVGEHGTLAIGDDSATARRLPVEVEAPATWASISIGGFFTCALTGDGHLWCAGLDASGQLGAGLGGDRHAPVSVGGGPWNAVSTGGSHSCARTASGEQACWGYNATGQLGDGTLISRQRPTSIVTTGAGVATAGVLHTCEIRPDGTLWCWGHNGYGQLGQGDFLERTGKVQVQPGTTWFAVAVAHHTCAIRSDQTLWCWGRNANYTLGDGGTADSPTPTRITSPMPDTWIAIAASQFHTCGIKTSLRPFCWGVNSAGQVGTGNTNPATTPQLALAAEVDLVAVGHFHTCVRRMSGHTLACWGDNGAGQLGDGTRLRRLQATEIATGTAWAGLAAGGGQTCAIDEVTQTLHCWGNNFAGQIGDGTVEDRLVPTPIRPDLDWAAVDPSGTHTCGIATTGDLMCWGDAGVGGLGDGTAWRSSLIEVP